MKLQLMIGAVLVSAVVGAETFTYTWDGTSESYGDGKVVVTLNGGSVTALTATVAEGDLVVFEGETAIAFAADATITVNGRGSLTFKNAAETLGALTLTSDAPRLLFDIVNDFPDLPKTTLSPGGKSILAFPGVQNLADYVYTPTGNSMYYNGKTTINNLGCYFPDRTETTYEYQGQNDNGAATFCVFFRFVQQDDGVAITNAAAYRSDKGNQGVDFRGSVPGGKRTYPDQILKAALMAERLEGRREVTFESDFTAGGQVTVAGGVNLRGTAKAFKTGQGETFDLSVKFDNGSLTCLEFGACNHAAVISGANGTIYYLTPDVTTDVRTYAYEDSEIVGDEMGIPTTDLVVLKNTSLASVTGLTARIKWNKYGNTYTKPTSDEQYARKDFLENPTPMYYELDPNLETVAVARFQMMRSDSGGKGLEFCAPIVLTQVGSDIAVRKVVGRYEWSDFEPRTWDPYRSDTAAKEYKADHFYITNLTFYTSKPIGGYAGTATFGTANSFVGSWINVVFKPGQDSGYRVKATEQCALAPTGGHSVYDGAWVCMSVTKTAAGGSLAWANGAYSGRDGYGFYVYPGGRAMTLQDKNNNPGQTISVCGGEYDFMSGAGNATIANGKLSYVDYNSSATIFDYVGHFQFSDGGRTVGARPRLGSQYTHEPKVIVTGAKPCRCESGFSVEDDAKDSSKLVTLTMDIADVTGDAEVDLTTATVVVDPGVSVVKKGAGTVLFEAKNSTATNHPIRVVEGAIALGCTDCFTTNALFSLEGGSLTAAAGTVNRIGSLAVTEDATLALADGSSLTVADPTAEWTKGKIVNIVGDPEKSTLTFGEEGATLSRSQVRALRWNGEKCHVEPDGSVRPGGEGIVLIVR